MMMDSCGRRRGQCDDSLGRKGSVNEDTIDEKKSGDVMGVSITAEDGVQQHIEEENRETHEIFLLENTTVLIKIQMREKIIMSSYKLKHISGWIEIVTVADNFLCSLVHRVGLV